MVARVNSAEGQANGTVVTAANSGGTSGDTFYNVGTATGATFTFATAAAYKGSRGYRFTHDATSGIGAWASWNIAGWAQVRHRFYVRMTAYPAQSAMLAGASIGTNASYVCKVRVNPTGKLQLLDATNTIVWASSSALALNTWYRVEYVASPGPSTTTGTLMIGYAAGDAALAEQFSSSAQNVGTAGLGFLYVGKLAGVWTATFDVDDLAADDANSTGFLGISAASGTPVVVDPTPAPVVVAPALPAADLYSQAVRSSLAVWWTIDASRGGLPVAGASGMRPVGGSIVDTTKPGVRRTLSLELAPEPGLYDLLSPVGTQLAVVAHLRYTNQQVVDIPMGVFEIDSSKMSESSGSISLTAPDKWVRIQRARFIGPAPATSGIFVRDQLALLIKDAIGPAEPVNVEATSQAVMSPVVWEKDRDKAVIDLARDIGAWVYFDEYGVATIADIPTSGADGTYWRIDAAEDGVLIDADRETSRTSTYNVVVVTSSATDGERFPVQYVWDDDPSSPTYAGPSVPFASGTPFGVVPYYWDTPILHTVADARQAGYSILTRVSGLAVQVSLTSVPNPLIQAFDILDVVVPPEVWGGDDRRERHIVDTVTHPLTVDGAQRIDGRSTRADNIEGGS